MKLKGIPIRPIPNGPLNNKEIEELNAFPLANHGGLNDAMDFFTFDAFIAVLYFG